MNWYKIATRGRYPGQLQGDEFRPGDAGFTDALEDNEVVEGQYVNIMKSMVRDKRWDALEKYVLKLKNEGHSPNRVNSMLTRAMYGMKL